MTDLQLFRMREDAPAVKLLFDVWTKKAWLLLRPNCGDRGESLIIMNLFPLISDSHIFTLLGTISLVKLKNNQEEVNHMKKPVFLTVLVTVFPTVFFCKDIFHC